MFATKNDNKIWLVTMRQLIAPTRKNTLNICLKFMGKLWSTVFMSVENLEIIRPFGVVSKKSIGAPNTRCNRLWWMIVAACIVPYAWHIAAVRNVVTVQWVVGLIERFFALANYHLEFFLGFLPFRGSKLNLCYCVYGVTNLKSVACALL